MKANMKLFLTKLGGLPSSVEEQYAGAWKLLTALKSKQTSYEKLNIILEFGHCVHDAHEAASRGSGKVDILTGDDMLPIFIFSVVAGELVGPDSFPEFMLMLHDGADLHGERGTLFFFSSASRINTFPQDIT